MACVRFRRGKWYVDYRDQWKQRRWIGFPGTPEGEAEAKAECERILRNGSPGINPNITLGDYIEDHWLPVLKRRVDVGTSKGYALSARKHIPATLLRAKVREIGRPQIKRFLATLGEEHGLADSTVSYVANVVRSIFEGASDDELIPANPAKGVRGALRLKQEPDVVRAMDGAQLEVFLAAARVHAPGHYLELAGLAYTGVRLGEMRGLQTGDVDTEARTMALSRQVHDDQRIGPLKTRKARVVDMAEAWRDLLLPTLAARRVDAMRSGERGPWLFYPDWPAPTERDGRLYVDASVYSVTQKLRRAMGSVLKRARLPDHFTPHSLRHTFARVLLERGEDLLYVSRQLGHSSLSMTADVYGQWARVKARAGGANLLTGRG